MNSFDDIPHDAQLQALLDGELDRSAEEGMLSRISADPELQRQYHDLVEIDAAMREDARSLRVPPDATLAVFSALGFAVAPTPVHPVDATASAVPTVVPHRSSRTWMIVALLTIGLIAIILYIVLPGAGPTTAARSDSEKSPQGSMSGALSVASDAGTAPAPSPVVGVRRGAAGSPPATARNAGARAGAGVPARFSTGAFSAVDSIRLTEPETPAPARVSGAPDATGASRIVAESAPREGVAESEHSVESAPAQEMPTQDATAPALEQVLRKREPLPVLGLRFTVRGMASTSSPQATIGSQTNSDARNIAIGLDYAISERQHLGISIGREAFSQHFGRLEAGRYVTYEQNPLEYWAAAYYERTLAAIMPQALFLFARLDAGSVLQLGPMVRGSLGVRLTLVPRVEALLAAEGAIAGYRNESIWLTTRKLGGTAGLSIVF
ncbi:MAG: hypothetical protein IPP94_05695 [Ignavibacteria bacterium]|nr:hypothetical protein [Ignavibacteria bacterium]